MSYLQDHLKTCSYCREKYSQSQKPTVRIKAASSYYKGRKLSELAAVIKGTKTKAASSGNIGVCKSKSQKLKELGRLIRS